MQVHREEGSGLVEVRVRVDPEWLARGGNNSGKKVNLNVTPNTHVNFYLDLPPPLIDEDDDDEDDDDDLPPLDLWANTEKPAAGYQFSHIP